MNWRNILSLSAITALGLVILPGGVFAQQKTLKEQLVGTWTLVSWEQATADGTKRQDFGPNPKGVTTFDANGHVLTMYARPDLPKIAATDRIKVTPQEAQAINVGSLAYFGTYTVDEATKTITLQMESSTYPNQLSVPQKRVITTLTSEELKFNNPTPTAGVGQINIAYKRVK
jgi:Lipocalin-like domain